MTLSEKISHLCEINGVSRNKFEIESGVGRGQTARWDKNKPSGGKLRMAADYFGVSVEYLLTDDVVVPPEPHNNREPIHPALFDDRAKKIFLRGARISPKLSETGKDDGLEKLAEDERALLNGYRTMKESDKELMQDFARRLKNGN